MKEQDTVLARVAALKAMPTPKLKEQWRALFETAPPPYNRRFLESRLAYRIQELAYGGLKPETVRRCRTRFMRSAASSRSWIVKVGLMPICSAYSRRSRAPIP